MKKTLITKLDNFIALNYSEGTYFYYSTTVPDARYSGYRYFIKYHNTHSVYKAFKTQKELEIFLDDYLLKKGEI